MRTAALEDVRQLLRDHYGDDVFICWLAEVSQEEIDRLAASEGADENKKFRRLWCADLFSDEPKAFTNRDGAYMDVVLDRSMGYPQPLVVDEPNLEPGEPVGYAGISFALDKDGKVLVPASLVHRPGANGKAADPILEMSRSSLTKGQHLPGEVITAQIYGNSARIGRGPIEVHVLQVDNPADDWVAVEDVVIQSPDGIGLSGLLKGLLASGLVHFGSKTN